MAPIQFLTPDERREAILSGKLVISGGADDDATTDAPAEGDAATADDATAETTTDDASTDDAATASDETEAAKADDGAEPAKADDDTEAAKDEAPVIDLPAVPEVEADLAEIEDTDLTVKFDALGEAYKARRPHAQTDEDIAILQAIRADQTRISKELAGRTKRDEQRKTKLDKLDEDEPVLPEKAPAFASAAAVADNRPAQAAAVQAPAARTRPRAPMLASAGTHAAAPGSEIDLHTVGRSFDMVKRGRDGDVRLAAIPAYEDMIFGGSGVGLPEMLSSENSRSTNDRLIREAVEDFKARRAGESPARQGAICEPFDIIRDIPDAFTTAERVAPSLPSRPVGRLGFTFTPSITLAEVEDGTQVWDETDQANVDVTDPDTWKPIIDIDCPDFEVVSAEFVPAALRFDITTEMSNPERIANATRALMTQKTRVKEGRILQIMDTKCGAYTFAGDYGALPNFIEAMNSIIAQLVYVDRLDEPNYTLYVPRALSTILGIDRAMRGYGQDLTPADVLNELARGLDGVGTVIETLDASPSEPGYPLFRIQEPGDAEIPIPSLSNEYRARLIDPTGAIYGETGEMNVGVTRSPDLLRQNKAQYFSEEAVMLGKHGPQHWVYVDVDLCANGARAGLVDPADCVVGS